MENEIDKNEPQTAVELTFHWCQEYKCLVNVPTKKLDELKDREGMLIDWLHEEYKDHTSGLCETLSYELEGYEIMNFKWTPAEKEEEE